MTLTKEDKAEVAKMVARAVSSTTAYVESSDNNGGANIQESIIADVAGDPIIKYMNPISRIDIISSPRITNVDVTGLINGQSGSVKFSFPPNEDKFLNEFKRAQSYQLKASVCYQVDSATIKVLIVDP